MVVGRATAVMSTMAGGDRVDLIGPLGTTFTPIEGIPHMIAVAGGTGLPPLGFYCRRYAGVCDRVTLVIGAKTEGELLLPVGLMGEGVEILSYTEDGTKGTRGLATDGLAKIVGYMKADAAAAGIAACGPKEMLGEVHRIAESVGASCEVSVEEIMACGVGACMSCAIPASDSGYLHACTDGPVVKSSRIDFERWLGS